MTIVNFLLSNAGAIFLLILSILLICVIPSLIELWRITKSIRLMTNRLNALTDVKGWFDLFRNFKSFTSKK